MLHYTDTCIHNQISTQQTKLAYSEKITKTLISEAKCAAYTHSWKLLSHKPFKSFNKLGEEFPREGKALSECVTFLKGLFNKSTNLKEKIAQKGQPTVVCTDLKIAGMHVFTWPRWDRYYLAEEGKLFLVTVCQQFLTYHSRHVLHTYSKNVGL